MRFSEETLMAYADGELDPVTRTEIEAAMATDTQVARAVGRHRALRERVRAAYDGVLAEPVPSRLQDLAKADAMPAATDELAGRRAASAAAKRRFALPQWAAMAATLALGLFIGVFMLRGPGAPYQETAAGLVARGELADALTGMLAGESASGAVRVGISFRNQGGDYCRTFQSQQTAAVAGLACRSGEAWRIQVLAATPAQEGELRTAAAMPLAVLQAVDATIVGEPLDAAAEHKARDAGWRAGESRN